MYRSVHQQMFTLPDVVPALSGARLSRAHGRPAWRRRSASIRASAARYRESDFVGYMNNLEPAAPEEDRHRRAGEPEMRQAERGCNRWPTPIGRRSPAISRASGKSSRTGSRSICGRVQVLDVREPDEFTGPLGPHPRRRADPARRALRAHAASLKKDQPIVAVCRAGGRSAQATIMLQQAGFTKVANLPGGMLRWRAEGYGTDGEGI